MARIVPLATLALACATAAPAEEAFEGKWAAEPDWCAHADRIGSHSPAPILVTAEEVSGYENSCSVTEIRRWPEDAAWWTLMLSCESEGDSYQEPRLLMLAEPDVLWMFFGGGDPIRFTRCGG
ncbi:hypothetical protein [Frigidibacter sp. ROC022]|uniref:hypothetical protein n=1 Tax=Frigidibacter sp. ROC022 TaxID=2971796 RepID=UPI00215A5124|nr:hypothetical protein [Frigidibacter sp. ROC022]MCR8723669.1 hypothetical protein [Frigidibacter sp. ROC022]